MRRKKPFYLEPEATTEQLIRAAAANHLDWFGEGFRQENGVHWKDGLMAFPSMNRNAASSQLDTIIEYHRQRNLKQIACWSLIPSRPRDFGARLVARGFEWGWQPHWMALDLRNLRSDFPVPEGLRIEVDNVADWDVQDLPYYKWEENHYAFRPQVRFGAWLNGKIVGQSVLHMTTGRLGVAGIYSVGVVPGARRQGIGRAVSLAACQLAKDMGCHYALLNAATHIYERLGFVSLGYGQTWFMQAEALESTPSTPLQIAFFEAVGRSDLKALEALWQEHPDYDLDAPLVSGMTLMALAVQMKKPRSIRWLASKGAILDIIHAWEMGWHEEARRLLQQSPSLANRQVGRWGMTALHEASARNDIELARLALSAHPDLTLRDRQYNGTPLNWAEILHRPEIATLIRQQGTTSG